MKRSGHFIDSFPQNVIFILSNFLGNSGRLSSNVTKRVLESVMPCSKNLTNKDLFNIWVRIMRLLPSCCSCNRDCLEFKSVTNGQECNDGIENYFSLDDNEALQLVQSLWMDIMSFKKIGGDDQFMNFIAKGFVYEYGMDPPGKIFGVTWMTATIRRNFELFGSYIGLDCMKCALNDLLCHYISIAMYNKLRQICVGFEGILCGEKRPMYEFLCDFHRKNAPGREFESVKVVASNKSLQSRNNI